jgi:DNA repair exonuclease SbcCD nuclease subunit
MPTPVRFIHTADWQLGLRAHFIPGEAGAAVREERFRTVRRIGEVAREAGAEFVLVAGDVFEHHALKPDTVRRALDAMGDIPVPVYLLPGNHDPLTSDALYRRELWLHERPSHVHVLDSREPVVAREGVALFGCPLLERHTLGDTTEHLSPELGPADHVRIGVAHGGIKEILEGMVGEDEPLHNTIALGRAEQARLDYLALGDWHGTLKINERTWYSGTPEATRFKERDPGSVLVVEIEGPGAVPRVTMRPVRGMEWRKETFTLDSEADLEGLERSLERIPKKDMTLLELTLVGTLEAPQRGRLEDEILPKARDRFRFIRVREEGLHTLLGADGLASLPTEGWLGRAVEQLRGELDKTTKEERERALRLLYRLHKEAQCAAG